MQDKVTIMNQENALEVVKHTHLGIRTMLNNDNLDNEEKAEGIDLIVRMAVMEAYKDGFDNCYEQMKKNKREELIQAELDRFRPKKNK